MSRKFLVVVNPAAGGNTAEGKLDWVKTFFTGRGVGFDVVFTDPKNFSLEINENGRSYTDILAIGGDGTINIIINSISGPFVPVSVIPAGTGNDFVKNLNVPEDVEGALETALNGRVKWIDCGLCNGRRFINGLGIGFDGKVVEEMNGNRKRGRMAYLNTVIKTLAHYRETPLTYSIGNETYISEVFLMAIANGTTFGGGFVLTPEAKVDDGFLDVCLIHPVRPLKRFLKLPLLKKGVHGKLQEVNFFRTRSIAVEGDRLLSAHLDGELIGSPPFNISVIPKMIPFRSGDPN